MSVTLERGTSTTTVLQTVRAASVVAPRWYAACLEPRHRAGGTPGLAGNERGRRFRRPLWCSVGLGGYERALQALAPPVAEVPLTLVTVATAAAGVLWVILVESPPT